MMSGSKGPAIFFRQKAEIQKHTETQENSLDFILAQEYVTIVIIEV